MTAPIHYQIAARNPDAHLFEVRCTIADPHPTFDPGTIPRNQSQDFAVKELAA